jgi:phosphoglycolate phosphatase
VKGLLVDFGGVLTTNVFDSFRAFCEREGLDPDTVKRLFREDPRALGELRKLEKGELTEEEFAERFGPIVGVEDTEGLVDRLFAGMEPDEAMIEAVRQARAGVGRDAFEEAFETVTGVPLRDRVDMAGRTDHQIAVAMLEQLGHAGDPHLPRVLEQLGVALAAKADEVGARGSEMPGARAALEALAPREDVVSSLLTGNIEANAALKLAAFGLDTLVDLEVGGYGSDPHDSRGELVAVARQRTERKYGQAVGPDDTVLIGDTPLDIRAAHEAGARAVAVASGPYTVEDLREADAVLADLCDERALLSALGL